MRLGRASHRLYTRERGWKKAGPEDGSEGAVKGVGEGPGGGGLTSEDTVDQHAGRQSPLVWMWEQAHRGHFDSVVKGNDWSEAACQPEQPGTAALLGLPEGELA